MAGDLSIYRVSNDQVGHELIKTERFLVPVGTEVPIPEIKFDTGSAKVTVGVQKIISQIFNSLEEITENTVGDTNAVRVAEFKGMRFEVRGYPETFGDNSKNNLLAQQRADAVMGYLLRFGTPAWRLQARRVRAPRPGTSVSSQRKDFRIPQIGFVRLQ